MALLAFCALTLAQSSPSAASAANASKTKSANAQTAKFDPRDFSGVWNPAPYMQPKGEVNPLDLGGNPNPLPPFTPSGRAAYEGNKKFVAAGDVTSCDPYGVARNFFTPRPFEVINAKDRVLQHFEYYSDWREIWTDGRNYPDDLEPDYMGYSLGKWEGDTFVVDVTGFNGRAWLDRAGNFATDSAHVVERYSMLDANTLNYEATIEDPEVFTRPWKISFPLYRHREKGARLFDMKCVEFVEDLVYGEVDKKPTQ